MRTSFIAYHTGGAQLLAQAPTYDAAMQAAQARLAEVDGDIAEIIVTEVDEYRVGDRTLYSAFDEDDLVWSFDSSGMHFAVKHGAKPVRAGL